MVYMNFQKDCESGKYSSLVGWAISLEKTLVDSGNAEIQQLRQQLQTELQDVMVSRNVMSWAICLYFMQKVRTRVCTM